MTRPPLRLAVLVSGYGSNLQALMDAVAAGTLNARIVLVASDRPDARGLARARQAGLPTAAVDPADYPDRAAWCRALGEVLEHHQPELVVLAGFMKVLDADLVKRWAGRMINIHPSLLPRYRGLHTHRRALEAGDAAHGTSIHFVTEELDGGPVVLQAQVPVLPGDDETRLNARVQAVEHKVYPEVVGWIAEGRLALGDQGVTLDGRRLDGPVVRPWAE
ncbi:MAG: phosphoribosylglycinamide formyltransferase [Gammaproteobacteria bacterium]